MLKSKRFSSALVLLLVFIMLFSVLFIALEADHDCYGEGCAVCAQIRVCAKLLRNLIIFAAPVTAVWCLNTLLNIFADADCSSGCPHTLIDLKVKLSD